jgi:hypothetical protein
MSRQTIANGLRILRFGAYGGLACAVLAGVIGMEDIDQAVVSAVGFGGLVVWKLSHLA